MTKKISLLIHGYNKHQDDMMVLAKNLEKLHHTTLIPDLPLTFHDLDEAETVFLQYVQNVLKNMGPKDKINLIGHSTGGLIIRKYLSQGEKDTAIDKCVLIATPNQGSELADFAGTYFAPLPALFKTLKSLETAKVKRLDAGARDDIPVGAIAGRSDKLFLGKLLKGDNDGRVTVRSVYMPHLADFIVLPYHHKEIHYQWTTAQAIDCFIEQGRFERTGRAYPMHQG